MNLEKNLESLLKTYSQNIFEKKSVKITLTSNIKSAKISEGMYPYRKTIKIS